MVVRGQDHIGEGQEVLALILLVTAVLVMAGTEPCGAKEFEIDDSNNLELEGLVRGYYVNDQRIRWSGLEETFGAEGVIRAHLEKQRAWGKLRVDSEFFVNVPTDDNILTDEARRQYHSTFEIEPFEVSRLHVGVEKGGFTFKIGKEQTPFGRTYFELFSNSRFDAPFIRTEAIVWRETGIFLNYERGLWVFEAALVNGVEDRDNNSSRAGIARVGLQADNWACGVSGKIQDGVGSGWEKKYNNHAGVDFMIGYKGFAFSGEVIYDEYGFRGDYEAQDVGSPRSLYYRDIFLKMIRLSGELAAMRTWDTGIRIGVLT